MKIHGKKRCLELSDFRRLIRFNKLARFIACTVTVTFEDPMPTSGYDLEIIGVGDGVINAGDIIRNHINEGVKR